MKPDKILLNAEEVAEALGVSERVFHSLRKEPWFPLPIELGPRSIRWLRSEVEAALATNAPRASNRAEPAQLRGSRGRKASP